MDKAPSLLAGGERLLVRIVLKRTGDRREAVISGVCFDCPFLPCKRRRTVTDRNSA